MYGKFVNNKTKVSPRMILRGDNFEFLKVLWVVDEGQLKRKIARFNYLVETLDDLEAFADIAKRDNFNLAEMAKNFKLPQNCKAVMDSKMILER